MFIFEDVHWNVIYDKKFKKTQGPTSEKCINYEPFR